LTPAQVMRHRRSMHPIPVITGDYNYNAGPRLTNPAPRATPQPQYGEADQDDIFEQPAPRPTRRATANDYQQAYREVESGYEEEQPRSRGPLILLALLALALVVGFGSVWAYNIYVKPRTTVASTGNDQVKMLPRTPNRAQRPARARNRFMIELSVTAKCWVGRLYLLK
jgi:hypothetical protein